MKKAKYKGPKNQAYKDAKRMYLDKVGDFVESEHPSLQSSFKETLKRANNDDDDDDECDDAPPQSPARKKRRLNANKNNNNNNNNNNNENVIDDSASDIEMNGNNNDNNNSEYNIPNGYECLVPGSGFLTKKIPGVNLSNYVVSESEYNLGKRVPKRCQENVCIVICIVCIVICIVCIVICIVYIVICIVCIVICIVCVVL